LEDWDFLIKAAKKYKIKHIPKITTAYRHFVGLERVSTPSQAMLDTMKKIYSTYPVESDEIEKARHSSLVKMAGQIRLVNRKGVESELAKVAYHMSHGEYQIASTVLQDIAKKLPNDGEMLFLQSKITSNRKAAKKLALLAQARDPYFFGMR